MGRRKYTPKEKMQIVFEGLSNPDGISEVCRHKGISTVQFYQWKDKIVKSAPEIFARKNKKSVKEIEGWSIETFYKDSKQNLGLEDYELRKIKGIIRHWYLVFSAYTLLQLSSSEKSLTKWINSNLNTSGDQCRFAVNETIKYFALWVMKMYHSINDEEKVVTLIFNPKEKLRFSLE